MKLLPITTVLSTLFLNLIPTIQPVSALTVNVNCRPAETGTYTLGWGKTRLIVPKNARPYIMFRGKIATVNGTICKSGDNVGLVVFNKDGTVWAYTRVNENE